MLHIHQALQSGGYPNASRLAIELEVSTKSVHRDLEFMRERLQLPPGMGWQPQWLFLHRIGNCFSYPADY